MAFTLAGRIVKVEYVGLNNCAAAGLTQWRLVFARSDTPSAVRRHERRGRSHILRGRNLSDRRSRRVSGDLAPRKTRDVAQRARLLVASAFALPNEAGRRHAASQESLSGSGSPSGIARPPRPSSRVTVLSPWFATHTDPASTAMAEGWEPTRIAVPTVVPVRASICVTVPSP